MSNPILTVFDDAGNAIPIPGFGGSGGGASEWKTAMEYNAITEDIGTLTVDTPDATEIEIYIDGIANNADNNGSGSMADFALKINNTIVGRAQMYIRASGAYPRYYKILLADGFAYNVRAELSDTSYATYAKMEQNCKRSFSGKVNTFTVATEAVGMLIKAGAKIGIRYR